MLTPWSVAGVAAAYLGLLFAIAHHGERRAASGRSVVTPTVYALSLAVYATSWTFYGSVGRAAATGVGFLPVYLGPAIVVVLWWGLLRKVIRISKANRITSIADFIASRYGKSTPLGGLVTIIAVVGILPYIALQLKAVSATFTVLTGYPEVTAAADVAAAHPLADQTLWAALLLAAFTILFGARHLEATERHEGMVAAIAFESVVKLVAFLAVGIFVTFSLSDGPGELFRRGAADPALAHLLTLDGTAGSYGDWLWLTALSALAVMFLPRQFQVAVVENVDERHVGRAMWMFPAYLLAINVFVLPITFAGLLRFPDGNVDADMFVLALPLAHGQELLALVVFIGGLSASTAMVIVETTALSTMVSNDLVMPVLVRSQRLRRRERADLSRLILNLRRATIVVVLLLGYSYFRIAGEAYALVTIGLVSFAAVAQFAPAFLFGLYWKGGTARGALAGLTGGFAVWAYTLLLPSFVRSGWWPTRVLDEGPFGIAALSPIALFGMTGLDEVSHAMFWSMLVNVGLFVGISLAQRPGVAEHGQAAAFVDAFDQSGEVPRFWRGGASTAELRGLLARFLGAARAAEVLSAYAADRGVGWTLGSEADADLLDHVERVLGGAVGAASARVAVATVVEEEPIGLTELMDVLEETSQAIAHSRALEEKSRALEAATAQLRAANERLTELDRLKDEFMSTVTHELRTPLTSIRSFSEILRDSPDLEVERRQEFLGIIISESERLTRLINAVLDLAKIESGTAEWHIRDIDLADVVDDAVRSTRQLFAERGADLRAALPADLPAVRADGDRILQVLLNLLSNAVKFCDPDGGTVELTVRQEDGHVRVDVADNGPGIGGEHRDRIFERFDQGGDTATDTRRGTGLGLPISRQIIDHLGGRLWLDSDAGEGARFSFTLPLGEGDRP